MENMLFAFRAAPNTAQGAPHRFPRSEQRETVGRLRPRSDHRPGGAGNRNQQPHPFPPTLGIGCTGAKAGKSGSAKIIRVPPAPQLHRGAIRAERSRFIFATGATGGLERRSNQSQPVYADYIKEAQGVSTRYDTRSRRLLGLVAPEPRPEEAGAAKIIRVLPAPQLHRGAIRAELWRVIFAAGATGGLERRGN